MGDRALPGIGQASCSPARALPSRARPAVVGKPPGMCWATMAPSFVWPAASVEPLIDEIVDRLGLLGRAN